MGRVIAAPQERFAQGRRKGPQAVAPRRVVRPERVDEPEVQEGEGGYFRGRKRTGVRLTFRGGLPETWVGRIVAGTTALVVLGAVAAGAVATKRMMLRDQRFVLPSEAAILTTGNERLSRPELLRVLRPDVGQNVLSLSLQAQRAALEAVPWVERATVERMLPDHLRAVVTERTPVAFVREKGQIGLVDANGVLLDLRQGPAGSNYSFPVVTGVLRNATPAERATRMRTFEAFVTALDGTGEHLSGKLSEVDLSNPEDVKALIPENGAEILVHFGEGEYLERYRRFEAHLPEWRQQFPHLASVDMRYDRQAVLEMAPGSDVPVNEAAKVSPLPVKTVAGHAVAAKATGHAAAGHATAVTHAPVAGHAPAVAAPKMTAAARASAAAHAAAAAVAGKAHGTGHR